MSNESEWIEKNIVNIDKGDIKRRLKYAVSFKARDNEVLEDSNSVTKKYTLLGFSIKELGRTAEVMYGYNGDLKKIYVDYLTQAITDALRTAYDFDMLSEKDYDNIVSYGKFLVEEIDRLSSKEIYFTLSGLYKVFK